MTLLNAENIAGIDIGGTNVRVAILTPQGKLCAERSSALEPERGPAAGIALITRLIRDTVRDTGNLSLAAIGVGATGPVDPLRGLIQNPYTLPTWDNVPIVQALAETFGIPVTLENDADSAALGEYWLGAGKNVARLYAVTVGTGIGTAFLENGEVYRGLYGSHPEAGHQLIDPSGPLCYCGVHGCWESLSSGTAIARFAQEQSPGTDSRILTLANQKVDSITAAVVAQAARENDPLAKSIISKAAYEFSRGLLNIIAFFVPDVIVLSGGVMHSLDLFLPAIEEAVQRYSVMAPANRVQILPAQLGNRAGVIGAAYAALRKLS